SASIDDVAQELGLSRAPSDSSKVAFWAASFGPEWVLLQQRMVRNGVVAEPTELEQLGRKWRVVGCDEESHVMYSASSEWRDGREVWAVVHKSEEAIEHLDVRGSPSQGWTAVRDEHLDQQTGDNEVDHVYEIPLVLAQRVVGYRLETEADDNLELVPL